MVFELYCFPIEKNGLSSALKSCLKKKTQQHKIYTNIRSQLPNNNLEFFFFCICFLIYRKLHTIIMNTSWTQGFHLLPLHCRCIITTCWHMLEQLGRTAGAKPPRRLSGYFVPLLGLSTLMLQRTSEKSSARRRQNAHAAIFVFISV